MLLIISYTPKYDNHILDINYDSYYRFKEESPRKIMNY